MAAADLAMLDAWAKGHAARGTNGPTSTAEMALNSPARRAEAGLRVCPRCGKPIHLGADACRACGISVPSGSRPTPTGATGPAPGPGSKPREESADGSAASRASADEVGSLRGYPEASPWIQQRVMANERWLMGEGFPGIRVPHTIHSDSLIGHDT